MKESVPTVADMLEAEPGIYSGGHPEPYQPRPDESMSNLYGCYPEVLVYLQSLIINHYKTCIFCLCHML
jgi:hypothetical protein